MLTFWYIKIFNSFLFDLLLKNTCNMHLMYNFYYIRVVFICKQFKKIFNFTFLFLTVLGIYLFNKVILIKEELDENLINLGKNNGN